MQWSTLWRRKGGHVWGSDLGIQREPEFWGVQNQWAHFSVWSRRPGVRRRLWKGSPGILFLLSFFWKWHLGKIPIAMIKAARAEGVDLWRALCPASTVHCPSWLSPNQYGFFLAISKVLTVTCSLIMFFSSLLYLFDPGAASFKSFTTKLPWLLCCYTLDATAALEFQFLKE